MKNDMLMPLAQLTNARHRKDNDPIKIDVLALKDLGVTSIDDAHKVLQNRKSPHDLKVKVCWALGQLRNKTSITLLLHTLEFSNGKIAWEASKALALIHEKRITPHLLELLHSSKNLAKRKAVVYALGELRDRKACHSLITILGNQKENSSLRGHAAEALAKMKYKKAVQPLIDALNDPKAEIRFWAAYALGEIKDRRAVQPLSVLADKDKSILRGYGAVRDEALTAITKILQ